MELQNGKRNIGRNEAKISANENRDRTELREYDERVRQEKPEKLKGSVCLNCDACLTLLKFRHVDEGLYICGLDGKIIEDGYSCCSEWKRKGPEKISDRFNTNEAIDNL